MSAEKEKKTKKKREKRQASSPEPSEYHVIAAAMTETDETETLQAKVARMDDHEQEEGFYLTEERERKGKQKKQQSFEASEAAIASEVQQTDAGKVMQEDSRVPTLTGRRAREEDSSVYSHKDKKRKKQKLETTEVESAGLSKEASDLPVKAMSATGLLAPLELLKVIRDRAILPDRKIQLAFDFIQTTQHWSTPSGQAGSFSEKGLISPSHFVTSLSEWVQSQISSASKAYILHPATNVRKKGNKTSLIGERPAHLDRRYWTVFRWCLLSGMEWKAGFISLSIMQALSCILDEASIVLSRDGTIFSAVKRTDLDNGTWTFTSTFFLVLFDVIKLLLHDYEGSFRPKLDMWISCTRSSLKLASLIYPCTGKRDVSTEGQRALVQLLLLLFRGFGRFLKSSPNPRKVFQALVEKLLESLLTLVAGLSMEESGSHGAERKDLLSGIESILKYSLFHPFHIDGYVNVCKVSQQTGEFCNDAVTTEPNVTMESNLCNGAVTTESNKLHNIGKSTHVSPSLLSYHKLLFQKLDNFVKEGKVSTLGSVAWILRTYIQESKSRAVSQSSTFLGAKNKHAKRPGDGENLGVDTGLDKSHGKKDSQGNSFFAMFAELLFPLLKQFEVLMPLCPSNKNFETSTLPKAKSLLTAANSLLMVAKGEQVYVSTEDTPSLSHLSFMKIVYNKLIQLGSFLPEFCSEMVLRHAKTQWSEEAQCLLMAMVNEVILGIGHIMELEYRVLDNDLQSIWKLILFGATLHSIVGKNQRKAMEDANIAVTLASSAMKIFGELRQVDFPLFSLCHFLRQLMITEQGPLLCFGVKLQCKALMSIYLSPKLLQTLATVLKEVPEGQLASFLKLLNSDMEETLKSVQKVGVLHRVNGHQMQQAGLKVLMEIYICILEHGNVTALNSIQVGISLRAFMDVIICPSLVYLVDSAVSGGNILANFLSLANWENRTESMNRCFSKDTDDGSYKASAVASKDDIPIVLPIWEYIMRLYMSVKMLHRQCISLMPPKHARRACTTINDPAMLGLMGEATHGDYSIHKDGFFSCIKKGNISIFKFLRSIEDWLHGTGHKKVDSFLYTLDCIAVHSLSDVKRQLKALNFLMNQAEQPSFNMNECEEGAEEQSDFGAVQREMLNDVHRKKMQKIHKKLRREASSLVSFLTRWIRSLDFDSKYIKERDRSAKLGTPEGEALIRLDMGWNKVICNLNRQTLPVARWDLLCQNIDVWSELASEEDAIAFCRFMFGKTLHLEDEEKDCESFSCTVYSVTSNLLECDIFYEQQAIRGVFLETLCQEVAHRLSLSKVNITVSSSLQYIEGHVCNAQDFSGIGCGDWTKIKHMEFEELEEFASSLFLFDCDNREFTKSALTINLVLRAPEGYIKPSSAKTFISYIAKLESCMVVWFLTSRRRLLNADEPCSTIEFSKLLSGLELLLACRRSIESLLLQEGSLDCTFKDSYVIIALLQDFCSMYWPVLSMHAVAVCFDNFFNGLSDNALLSSGKDMLFSYLKCTTGLFTFFSQRFFREILNPLLLRSGNGQVSSLNIVDMDDSLGLLMTTLVAQLKKCSEFIKAATCDYLAGFSNKQSMEESIKKEGSTLQEHSFGVFALLGAVSSMLWSITSTLELLDEKCHLDKGGGTKWSGELPGILLSWIEMVESFAIDSLHHILLADRLGCVEMITADCGLDDDKLLVSPDKEVETKKVKTCIQNAQKHLASASSDVPMEAFQGSADCGDQESGSNDLDVDANEDSDVDKVSERDSGCVKDKLPEKATTVRKLSIPNVREGKHTSTQVFGDFVQMSDVQLSMVKVLLSGKLETLSWSAGELFMVMAAIVKLKSLFHSPNVTDPLAGELINQEWSSSMGLHVGAGLTILQEAAKMPQLKGVSGLILLPGVIKYLESFGSFLPYTKPTLAPTAFVKLFNLQMVLLGAVLSKSQATECLKSSEELASCLKSCFNMLIKKPLGLHFHLALQTIERTLLGFQGTERRICFGDTKPTSSLLGAIECLTVILDAVSGLKRLQILSKYCSRYLAAVFNLIATSQPSWHQLDESKDALKLSTSSNAHDAAILILKCIEIMVIVSSREVIFSMKANHVAQAMSCPAHLFKPFYQRNLQKEKLLQNIFAANERFEFSAHNALILDDQMLSSEIYVACCKLLRNLLRHRKRESGHCVALMGESVRALLFFLEVMELTTSSRQLIEERGIQCTIECASWLRRVYEEVAEHRDTLGSYIVHVLSDYICINSGYGVSIKGLSREVEATLRPGAYALVDICSAEDLQQLHAVLGEGPRRTALTELRHDYEKHFKYTGKV